MALTVFCPTCQRTVYIESGDTAVCPVCSSPLIEPTDAAGENASEREPEASSEG